MADLVALNLRGVEPELRAALKREAKAVDMDLTEYSVLILKARSYLPPSVIPRPASPVSATPIRQENAPSIGDWDKAGGTGATIPSAEQRSSPAPSPAKKACPHGWMNRALCQDCRAIA